MKTTTTHHIQARCRATGRTLIIREGLSAQEVDAWRPSPEDRVKYKYFRKGS